MQIYEEKKCSGCTACINICPMKCIIMKEDEKGFLYPEIDEVQCIKCNKCIKICPVRNEREVLTNEDNMDVYKARCADESILEKSSSGGIFSVIYKYILEKEGVVYGAGYNQEFEVKHVRCENEQECEELRGSKYVQSELGYTFRAIIEDLKDDKYVLFTGTPCQVDGLRKLLMTYKVSIDKLFLVDFICHGVPSPQIWSDYLNYLKKKNNDSIKDIEFRNKDYGWKKFSLKIKFENSVYHQLYVKDAYCILFSDNISLRPMCHECIYTNLNRSSDITIADYWKIEKKEPLLDDDKGLSMVLVNSSKGRELYESISSNIVSKAANLDAAAQPQLKRPTSKSKNSDKFWEEYNAKGIEYVLDKYGKYTFKKKMVREIIVPFIKKIGLFDTVLMIYCKIKK